MHAYTVTPCHITSYTVGYLLYAPKPVPPLIPLPLELRLTSLDTSTSISPRDLTVTYIEVRATCSQYVLVSLLSIARNLIHSFSPILFNGPLFIAVHMPAEIY